MKDQQPQRDLAVSIHLQKEGGLTLQDSENNPITIPFNDPTAIATQLHLLSSAQMDCLLQGVGLQFEQYPALFISLLNSFSKEKNVVRGSISNVHTVNIGDRYEINYHYEKPEIIPKELTVQIPQNNEGEVIGREHDLDELRNVLAGAKQTILINGIGGIGKTTLAKAYVVKFYDDYRHIAWISNTTGQIHTDFVNAPGLLSNLGISSDTPDSRRLFEEIMRKCKGLEAGPNLLVIDNGTQSLKEVRHLLPGPPKWHVLITSREEITGLYLHPLGFLDQAQAIRLFRSHYTHHDLSDQDMIELAESVEYHTLAIELLAKTAHAQHYDVEKLGKVIKENLRSNVEAAHNNWGKIEKIGRYFQNVFSISDLGENEYWWLKQLACLPNDFHSLKMLRTLVLDEEDPRDDLAEAFESINRKGWLLQNKKTDSYKMHPIIADTIGKDDAIGERDVAVLISKVTNLMRKDKTHSPLQKASLLPFGLSIVERLSAKRISSEMASLQGSIATTLRVIGRPGEARALFEKTLSASERFLGIGHHMTIDTCLSLASLLRELGDIAGAGATLEKARDNAEKYLGQENVLTMLCYSDLAGFLETLGEFDRAKLLLERVIRNIDILSYAPEGFAVDCYTNLGRLLNREQNFSDAKKVLEDAAPLVRQLSGPEKVTIIYYSELAFSLAGLRDYKEAVSLMEKVIAQCEKIGTAKYLEIESYYCKYAFLLRQAGNNMLAKQVLEKAVISAESSYGPDNPRTAVVFAQLAELMRSMTDFPGAKLQLTKAISILEKVYGKYHIPSLGLYSNLASLLAEMGEFQDAKKIMDTVVLSYENQYGSSHAITGSGYLNLADVYLKEGNFTGAKDLAEKAMGIYEKTFGNENIKLALVYNAMARASTGLADFAGDRRYREKVARIYEQHFGPDDPETLDSMVELAVAMQITGDIEKGHALMEKTLEAQQKRLGSDHPYIVGMRGVLEDLKQLLAEKPTTDPVYIDEPVPMQEEPPPENAEEKEEKVFALFRDADRLSNANDLKGERDALEAARLFAEHKLGQQHTLTGLCYSKLAHVYSQTDPLKARALFENAVLINELHFGKDHVVTADCYVGLALTLQFAGEKNRAITLLQQAVQTYDSAPQLSEDDRIKSLAYTSMLLGAKEDYEGRRLVLEKLLAHDEEMLGPEHPRTIEGYWQLAKNYESMQAYDKAKPLMEKALFFNQKVLGEMHPATVRSYSGLAGILAELGDYPGAKVLYEKAIAIDEQTTYESSSFGNHYLSLALVLNHLGDLDGYLAAAKKGMDLIGKTIGLAGQV